MKQFLSIYSYVRCCEGYRGEQMAQKVRYLCNGKALQVALPN